MRTIKSLFNISNRDNGASPPSPTIWKTTDSALLVVELLEAILLCLPLPDLLLAQRVCRHWRAVIQGSPPICKALFIHPVDGQTIRRANVQLGRSGSGTYHSQWRTVPENGITVTPVMNPFLIFGIPNDTGLPNEVFCRFIDNLWFNRLKTKPPPTSANRSWDNMLVMQPPVRAITYRCLKNSKFRMDRSGLDEPQTSIAAPNGDHLRLRHLMQGLRDHLDQCDHCAFNTHIWNAIAFNGIHAMAYYSSLTGHEMVLKLRKDRLYQEDADEDIIRLGPSLLEDHSFY